MCLVIVSTDLWKDRCQYSNIQICPRCPGVNLCPADLPCPKHWLDTAVSFHRAAKPASRIELAKLEYFESQKSWAGWRRLEPAAEAVYRHDGGSLESLRLSVYLRFRLRIEITCHTAVQNLKQANIISVDQYGPEPPIFYCRSNYHNRYLASMCGGCDFSGLAPLVLVQRSGRQPDRLGQKSAPLPFRINPYKRVKARKFTF